MLTEKGILPVGIEKDGVWHREFEIRPGLVKDTIEVGDEHGQAELRNQYFVGICLTAKQLVRIGEICPVTADVVAGMYDVDLAEISTAKQRLAMRLAQFRKSAEEQGSAYDAISGGAEGEAQTSVGPPGAAPSDGADSGYAGR